MSKKKRWTRHHDCCIKCGTKKRSHSGLGLCYLCYYRHKHPAKPKLWGNTTDKCKECGTDRLPHLCLDMCSPCYHRLYYYAKVRDKQMAERKEARAFEIDRG